MNIYFKMLSLSMSKNPIDVSAKSLSMSKIL